MNTPSSYLVLQDQPSDYLLMLDMSQITACQVLRSLSGTRLNLVLHNGLTLEIPPDPANPIRPVHGPDWLGYSISLKNEVLIRALC